MAYSKSNAINVSFTGTSQSQDLSGKAKQITVSASADCYISFDSTTVSAGNGFLISADRQYTFDILYPAQVSVIQDSGAGILSIMELGDAVGLGAFAITVSDTFAGDSSLLTTIAASYDADSSLLAVVSDSFSGDCTLVP
jgi:hypothetical protein